MLLTRIWPNCVRSACAASKWIEFVLWVSAGEEDVVVLGDRAAEAAAEDVADVEVLVEAALPDFRCGSRRQWPCVPPFASDRILRARSTTGASIISPSSATAPRPSRSPRLGRLEHALRPGDGVGLRLEHAVDDVDLRRVDAGLAAEAERAGEAGGRLEPRVVAGVEVDDVERAADPGRGRVGDDLRAGVEELEAVRPGLPAELGAEVGGAEQQRGHARARRRLVGEAQTLGRLDDRDHRRPVGPSAATASGVAFGRTSASSASSRAAARSSSNHGVPAPLMRTTGGRSRRTSSRAASLRSGVTASSRSATTASASDASAFVSFGSSEPGAKSSERSRSSAAVPPLCQTFEEAVKQRPAGCSLTRGSKVRHKRPYSSSEREVRA